MPYGTYLVKNLPVAALQYLHDSVSHLIRRGSFDCTRAKALWYTFCMTKKLKELLERVEAWPEDAQDELVDIVKDIEAGRGVYHATPEELEGIDRGLKETEQGLFATKEEVEAVLAKFDA